MSPLFLIFVIFRRKRLDVHNYSPMAAASTARKGLHVRRHTPLESVFDQENRNNQEFPSTKKDFDAVLKPSHTLSQLESTTKPVAEAETILVTGGAGYIGTHTIVLLINAGFNVVVVDNLVNSSEEGILV